MDTLAVHLLNALLYASVMFLIAGGLSLIYGVMRIVNLAHGNLYAFGAYVSAWAVGRVLGGAQDASLWLYALLPVGAVAAAALGAVLEPTLLRPLYRRAEEYQLLITFGLAMALENGLLAVFGPDHRSVQATYANQTVTVLGVHLTVAGVIAIAGSVVIVGLLFLFVNRTRIGTAIRAVAQQPDSAELAGIDVRRVFGIAFALGTGLAGAAACFMAPIYPIQPGAGDTFGVMAFIIVILGGLGSVFGASAAALLIGVVQSVFATMISVQMATAFVFAAFIVAMIVRPNGIFGRVSRVA